GGPGTARPAPPAPAPPRRWSRQARDRSRGSVPGRSLQRSQLLFEMAHPGLKKIPHLIVTELHALGNLLERQPLKEVQPDNGDARIVPQPVQRRLHKLRLFVSLHAL